MSDTATESAAIPVPEPDLTPREIIARAAAMRETLRERQADTEERTFYSEETHKAFTDAGFYRILQPRRFGGYEFDLPTYYRVVMELTRGDISAGWCFCLGAAHVLQVSSMYAEQAQADFFGPDGHFICARSASRSASPSRATAATCSTGRCRTRRASRTRRTSWARRC